jgi:long-chain fatty acid transport protein
MLYIRAGLTKPITMKRLLLFSLTAGFAVVSAFAGGLVTNTNQSTSWVRNPAKDATRGIEATYYNPAGLMKLGNGLHFSLSNQYITQSKEVENFYKGPGGTFGINQSLYKGTVKAPLFPSVYAVYKMDKLAFSFGFNPVGGGGGATFDKGLPSFELSPSDLVPALASRGAQAYKLDAYFEGSSVYFGYQGGVTYKINDMFSVFGGIRYVTAKNTYLGHLNDVQLNMGGSWLRADAVFGGIVSQLNSLIAIPGNLQPIVDGGGGSLTLAQAQGANIIDAGTKGNLEAGLAAIGVPAANIPLMSIAQIQGAFTTAAPALSGQRNIAAGTAHVLRNQSVDAEQTGSGICPIIGVNISPSEKLNIGIKYEFITKMDLTNKTTKDFTTSWTGTDSVTMFPDGEKTKNDMPGMLSVGASYDITDKLNFSLGTHYYFDKGANYGKKVEGVFVKNDQVIDKNFYEIAAGLEYKLSEKLLVSAGYLIAQTGVNTKYQSDLSYSNSSSTVGFGGAYNINEKIQLNLGAAFTMYKTTEKTIDHVFNSTVYPARETYWKNTMILSLGLNFSL